MKRELTMTVVVEHVSGPYLEEHWEQPVPAQLENALEDMDVLTVNFSEYRIAQARVEDVTEVAT